MKSRIILSTILTLFFTQILSAQTDTVDYSARKVIAGSSCGLVYAGSLSGLYFLWYNDYSSGNFHLFNDNAEWLCMDKVGHAASSFHISRIQSDVFEWSGVPRTKSVLYGSAVSLAYMSAIEIFDGFSSGWGFSWGDMCANLSGTVLFASQELLFDRKSFTLKFSTYPSSYAKYNPNLLGENFIQQRLKDYNSQTYWLSFNIASCLKTDTRFPQWLNVAFGYGASGMIGAESNPQIVNNVAVPNFNRNSQYYLSADIDFSKIKIQNPYFAFIVKALNFIKMPSPTLEWNKNDKLKFHYLFF